MTSRRLVPIAAALSFAVLAASCTSSSNSASTSTVAVLQTSVAAEPGVATTLGQPSATTAAPTSPSTAPTSPSTVPGTLAAPAPGAIDPNAPEVVDPGDIPDNQAFVAAPSADGTFTVKVPEGWARTDANGAVGFTDKYNSIVIQSQPATAAPTVESVTASGLTDVASSPSFSLVDVQPVTRKSGAGIVATYEIGSALNAVTGKSALLAVERYFFAHSGAVVILTLSGAKGADNVDPWKIVTDSLTWSP